MKHTTPKISNKNKADWFVWYRIENPETKQMVLIKERAGINRVKNIKERRQRAEALCRELNERLKNGWSPFNPVEQNPLEKMILLLLFDEFFKIKKASLRKRSWQHYKYGNDLLKEYLTKCGRTHIYIYNFTRVMAQDFSDFLIVDKKFGGKSHNNQIGNLKVMFNMAIDRELISKNPFKDIKKKPVDVGKNIAFSDLQRKKISEYLEQYNPQLLLYCKFIYYCAIRPNELMQIKVKHIDFESRQVMIPSEVSKNRKQSSVELPSNFYAEVKKTFKGIDPEYYLFGRGLVPGVIAIHRNRATEAHKKVLEYLNISNQHTLYSWKHSGAVAAIKAGINPYSLMRQWRHHSLEQTMTYLKSLGLTSNSEFSSKQPKF